MREKGVRKMRRKTKEESVIEIRQILTRAMTLPVLMLASSWPYLLSGQRIRGWLIVFFLSFLVGCSSAPRTIGFQHNYHRQVYSFTEGELKNLQFYISRDVLAQYQDTTGTKSILLARLTPGVVTSAGPDWLKVSFREGGINVPFITDLSRNNDRYWLATAIKGEEDFKKIKELPEKVFLHKGTRYKLAYGANAFLLVDWEGWKKLVETRKATGGRQVSGN